MSRHEGVSCDSCTKSYFRGRRYKCLVCYDYDLCSTCYEAGATTSRHSSEHPMQCILTRTDFDLFYGGEALTPETPQSFTCPYCGKMGYTETSLQEHVTAEHSDTSTEVVCPVCASLPGGDPNHVTDDFAAHLTLEHRAPRDFDEPSSIRQVRRIAHSGRGFGGMRARRTNMHFSGGSSALTGLSPSSRESMDPIAELLSQLSSVRSRAAAAQSVSSQLQQLEMQLQSTRYAEIPRQQLERLPRSQVENTRQAAAAPPTVTAVDLPTINTKSSKSNNITSQFLLSRIGDSSLSEPEQLTLETDRADRSVFVQELMLATLAERLSITSSDEEEEEEYDPPSAARVFEEPRQTTKRPAGPKKHKMTYNKNSLDNRTSGREPPPH